MTIPILERVISADIPYPLTAVADDIKNAAASMLFNKSKINPDRLIIFLECYLQITEQELNSSAPEKYFTPECLKGFIGCLLSGFLTEISDHNARVYALACLSIFRAYGPSESASELDKIERGLATSQKLISYRNDFIQSFQDTRRNKKIETIWRGRRVESKDSHSTTRPVHELYAIEIKFGVTFANEIHTCIKSYCQGRSSGNIFPIKKLLKALTTSDIVASTKSLLNMELMNSFWKTFIVDFFSTSYDSGNGKKIATIQAEWRALKLFCEDFLVPINLVSTGSRGIPDPKGGPKATIGKRQEHSNGEEFFSKLLSPIPLEISDQDCLDAIVHKLQEEVSLIKHWAKCASQKTWQAHKYQKRLAKIYSPTLPTKGRRAHKKRIALARAAHNLETLNLSRIIQKKNVYLPKPYLGTVSSLGLPYKGALIPFCVLLIINHPEITPSFLDGLKMFDKSGKIIGLANDNKILVGYKPRKGGKKAQQNVTLNPESLELIWKILDITSSARKYLREIKSPDAQYLLLTTGPSLSTPRRIRSISAEVSYQVQTGNMQSNLEKLCSTADCNATARYFSLGALRASIGVLDYFKSGSISKLGTLLGHEEIRQSLIDRYLPPSISGFFRDRWIRLFQEGIICEALADSPYLFEASSFNSIEELDAFMRTHALKIPKEEFSAATPTHEVDSEVYVGINQDIMDILWGLKSTPTNNKSSYKLHLWKSISEHVIDEIQQNKNYYPTIYNLFRLSQNKPIEAVLARIPA